LSLLNSPRALKVALAASVALNLFAIAGGATLWVTKTKAENKIEAAQTPGRQSSFRDILAGMEPATRDRVRSTFRASAMAARPDFEASRAARRQAVELMRGPKPDAAAANALLDQSRAAEMRGRARLEHDATAVLATLDPDDRAALAVILTRRGKGAAPADQRRGGPGGPGSGPGDRAAPLEGSHQGPR
jgi:uncharacterized membrane protein